MKRITIGRNPSCDVVIDNKMVSRNHALLNIYPSGKLEIVSMGTNGTKVKGHLISNGQRYPLRRGDDVTFAGCEFLDWRLVPDPMKIWKILGFSVIGAGVLALIIWGIVALSGHKTPAKTVDPEDEDTEFVAPAPKAPVQDKKEEDKKEDKADEKKDDDKSKADADKDRADFQKLFQKNDGTSKPGTGGKKTDTKKSEAPSHNDDMR